jgi:uncharacterized cupredoxin-like copper-binding protein
MRTTWIFLSLVAGGVMIVAGIGQAAPAAVKISMTEYKFQSDRIFVRAGQTAAISLVNVSTKKKVHEFMAGREVAVSHSRPAGFKRDFFDGLAIKISNEKDIWKLRPGRAKITGGMVMNDPGMAMEGHEGFMIELQPGGTATLTFTVPANRVGEWEIGCFSEAGQHYTDGMKGKLIVAK